MIDAFHHHGGVIRRRVIWVKAVASLCTLGTGGAGGREGPTMHIGGALGSLVARLLDVSARERRILLIAGVAAGISAVFRTPLGAALLAVEVLYRDGYESDALIPSVLASVVAYSIVISIFGESTLLAHAPRFEFVPWHLPLFGLLALVVAALAASFSAVLRRSKKLFAALPIPDWLRPGLGGLVLGALFTPLIMLVGAKVGTPGQGLGILGGGYGAVQMAITGAEWLPDGWGAVQLLFLPAIAKLIAASITLGSQGSAGDFAPSLAIGGLAGGAFGRLMQLWVADPRIDPGAFALVGMGVFYGGIAHVPLAALVLVCELAGNYDLLVPLMLAQGIAFVALRKRALYEAQVPTQRDSPVHRDALLIDLLKETRVKGLMMRGQAFISFEPKASAAEMLSHLAEATEQDVFPWPKSISRRRRAPRPGGILEGNRFTSRDALRCAKIPRFRAKGAAALRCRTQDGRAAISAGSKPVGKLRMSTTTQHRPLSSSPPPEAWEPLLRLRRLAGRPLERFLQIEAASGILLLVSAAIALWWANSSWADSYFNLWRTPVGLRIGEFSFERSLEWLVNDGLMVIFFFVVGMEIRREIYCGELSEWRRAALPAAAALGGMIAPAAIYLAIAGAPATRSGWGVPMATDIAFAVGILALLGKRVPAALRVLLLALAVIDDLGAIAVIALFYSSGVTVTGLLVAALGFVGVLVMQRLGVRSKLAYVAPALVAWAGVYAAGIHPTIAGVIVGLLTPVRAWLGRDGFLTGVQQELEHLAEEPERTDSSHGLAATLRHVGVARREALSPAESLIDALHPWVAYGIMPVFALANAGVSLSGTELDSTSWHALVAVTVGLIVGKPLGVLIASWLSLRLGVAILPAGLTRGHLVVLGMVAGIGFTMALFVAQLAFADAKLLAAAKLGVLVGSGGAALVALLLGRFLLVEVTGSDVARTADEAESSTSA